MDRVSVWLKEAVPGTHAGTVLVVGHRATFFALEHLVKRVPLHEVMASS